MLRGEARSDGASTALTIAGETVTAPRRIAGKPAGHAAAPKARHPPAPARGAAGTTNRLPGTIGSHLSRLGIEIRSQARRRLHGGRALAADRRQLGLLATRWSFASTVPTPSFWPMTVGRRDADLIHLCFNNPDGKPLHTFPELLFLKVIHASQTQRRHIVLVCGSVRGSALRPLPGDIEADVAIVGAGYTGLWTAYYLKKARPSLRIAPIEREFAGLAPRAAMAAGCRVVSRGRVKSISRPRAGKG